MNSGKAARSGIAAVAALLAFPTTASAHLTVQGLGDLGNGALHPLATPSHILILLALAVLLGRRIPLDLKFPMLVLAPASAIALLLTTTGWVNGVAQPFLTGVALVTAVLVALDIDPSREIIAGLCAAAAVGIGLDSGVETGGAAAVAKGLIGTWFSLNFLTGYLALCISNGAEKPWARIAMRVAGSWIIAISLLVLAFSLRK